MSADQKTARRWAPWDATGFRLKTRRECAALGRFGFVGADRQQTAPRSPTAPANTRRRRCSSSPPGPAWFMDSSARSEELSWLWPSPFFLFYRRSCVGVCVFGKRLMDWFLSATVLVNISEMTREQVSVGWQLVESISKRQLGRFLTLSWKKSDGFFVNERKTAPSSVT